jgi:hypothetical protein
MLESALNNYESINQIACPVQWATKIAVTPRESADHQGAAFRQNLTHISHSHLIRETILLSCCRCPSLVVAVVACESSPFLHHNTNALVIEPSIDTTLVEIHRSKE